MKLTKENFNGGNFNIELNVPKDNKNVRIDIIADKSFIPVEHDMGADGRVLRIFVKEISLKFDLR